MAGPACRRRVHGLGQRSDRHRRRRHGWRRRLHQPRFSGQGHPVRLFDPAALDRGRHGRACAGCFPTANLARCFRARAANTISWPRLSSGFRISGGLGVGDGRFRGTGGAGRDGLRRVWQIAGSGAPPLALAIGVVWLVSIVQLTGVRHSSTFQLISTVLKVVLIVAFLIAGFVVGTPQPVSFMPDAHRFRPCRQRAVRDRAGVRDVFVLRLERRDLHHRRDARPRSRACRARCWRER